jgi:hypothetical protein
MSKVRRTRVSKLRCRGKRAPQAFRAVEAAWMTFAGVIESGDADASGKVDEVLTASIDRVSPVLDELSKLGDPTGDAVRDLRESRR